ncbi:MAG: ClpXP protease specificity-enhancing factor [Acinetobacter populi]|jgi:stringent starvation protein B|uniref:ClpXP protease specificity-enhancing factor n=1 Tax=Acinetobacter populi TaxID=1582270 RepID=UPI002354A736|nr:ClpXP protease specificity-enhancing factor [Acinetobacter populi]MCH4248488.1 ClpXP protease specificity-enhancing factor [Acinetobacter populi]
MSETNLTPTRPYLARAIYEWICDNQLTPYLLVDATQKFVQVPQQHIKDGQIVLNIAPHAVHRFQIENEAIHFSARFGGVSQDIYVPMSALIGIYSRENGQGLFFDPQEYDQASTTSDEDAHQETSAQSSETTIEAKKKPSLRVLD